MKNLLFSILFLLFAISSKGAKKSASVLAAGNWYKIAISADGIYKIDKQFLENCGINTTSLNPNSIHIYGNGDGLLPVQNNEYRTDDLAKNAIHVHGDADGSFDSGDYILFYGWGPHRWKKNGSTGFDQQRNQIEEHPNTLE